jgi:hypothetical protein
MKPIFNLMLCLALLTTVLLSTAVSGASKNPLASLNMTDIPSVLGKEAEVVTGGVVSGKCLENVSCDEPGAVQDKGVCVKEVMCPLARKLIADTCFFFAGIITVIILPPLLFLMGRDIRRKDYKHPIRWAVTVVMAAVAALLFLYPIETLQAIGII